MSDTPTIIESVGVYLPPKSVTTEEILRGCNHRLRLPFESLSGIHSRRVAGETEFAIDLAEKAILDCLQHSHRTASEIDILISANISRYDGPNFQFFFEPSTSVRLKQKLGFRNALTFDVTCACAGMFTAIHVIDIMIRAGIVKCGMVVSGEYITHLTRTAQKEIDRDFDQRLACLTLGDAGAAVILEAGPSDQAGFHAIEAFTRGEYSHYCIAKPSDKHLEGAIMITDMVNLSAVASKYAYPQETDLMRRHHWGLDQIQHVLIHQTSKRTIEGVAREMRRRVGRAAWRQVHMINNLADRGNTASTTHFVALKDCLLAGKIHEGDRMLFNFAASGITVGSALYTFDDLSARIQANTPTSNAPQPLAATPARHFTQKGLARVRLEGFGTHCVAPCESPNSLDLMEQAARRCLEASCSSFEELDLLIHAGVYRSECICEPAIAALLAGKLGCKQTIQADQQLFAFDLMNGGLGFLSACFAAIAMLQTRRYHKAMVVAAEIENNDHFHSPERRGLRQAASAVMLGSDGNKPGGFGGFLFQDSLGHIESFKSHLTNASGKIHLTFERRSSLEEAFLGCVEQVFHGVLEREGLSPGDVSVVLAPQISSSFISGLRQRLPVLPEKVIDATSGEQDLFTSSLGYSLELLYRQRHPLQGEIGIILGVGTGIQAGGAIYYF